MWQIRKPKDQATPEEVAERTEEERRLVTTGDAGAFAHNELHTDLKVELHQRLLGLINLEIWCRLYLDRESAAGVADKLRETLAA